MIEDKHLSRFRLGMLHGMIVGMTIKLVSYALEGIEAVPVDVALDGNRVKVVYPESGESRLSRVRSSPMLGQATSLDAHAGVVT